MRNGSGETVLPKEIWTVGHRPRPASTKILGTLNMPNKTHEIELIFHEVRTSNDLFCQFDEQHGVLLLDIKNPFSTEDFQTISSIIEPYFAERGELNGIIINAKKFFKWTSPQNRAEYLGFVAANHRKFKKAALAMGGFFVKVLLRLAKSRIHPEVKTFKHNQIHQAQKWMIGDLIEF
jgi:hypothetical protein